LAKGFPRDPALDAATGVYVGCMYTEYLDGVLAKQVCIERAVVHVILVADSIAAWNSQRRTCGQ